MVTHSRRIEFRTFEDMAAHLDAWAAHGLATPADWQATLLSTREWLDYSSRNQALLASYGVDGPVAGVETWRLVPAGSGRTCAVRSGERGYPIRVPVTTQGAEPDPYLGGTRPTRAAVERWEWRPVFGIDQLARRPSPDMLAPATFPDVLSGPDADAEFLAATRKVASSTVRGRLPKLDDPHRVLADAAGRVSRSGRQAPLDPVLRDQVAWLVAHRVERTTGELPDFDPAGLSTRERWQRLTQVLEPARKLTGALGVALGEDLLASPLPRMTVADDRVVPAARRHRLPQASFEQLPVGRWVEVGPYTEAEWHARGETGAGRGAYLRLNRSAYLVAVEHGTNAAWRLEDVASRTGHGLLASGTATSLADAQTSAISVVHDRYPALAPIGSSASLVPSRFASGWESLPGEGRSRAEVRRVSDEVTIYALPGPGGRWMPAVQRSTTGTIERLSSTRTRDEARDAAELAGRRAERERIVTTPVEFDTIVVQLATSDDYNRRELASLVGRRLEPEDQARLAVTVDPAELVELLGAAGVTPATSVLVLHADGVDAHAAAAVLPIAGVPMSDGIRALEAQWGLARLDGAVLLGANAREMRDAGCDAVDILAARPREVLRTLPADPHVWELAAGTMIAAGHPPGVTVRHLVAHAPTPDAFAAGLETVTPDPLTGFTLACAYGADAELLAASSERYGLSPPQTATVLADAGTSPPVLVEVLLSRCDGDVDVARGLAESDGRLDRAVIDTCLTTDGPSLSMFGTPATIDGMPSPATLSLAPESNEALLAALPPAAATSRDLTESFELPEPATPGQVAFAELPR